MMKKTTLLTALLLLTGIGAQAQSEATGQMDERFNDGKLPYGWFAEGWEVKDGAAQKKSSQGFDMSSLMGGGGGSANYLLTPPLTVAEGESLVFAARKGQDSGMGSMMGGSDSTFVVEYEVYSEHRWKRAADFTTALDSVYKTFTIGGIGAGEYRFRFKAAGNVSIDSVAGFHIDMEAPDIYVIRDSVAATDVNIGVCAKDTTATFTVINTATGTLNATVGIYDDESFTLDTSELAVAAGDSATVAVSFVYEGARRGRNTTEVSFKPADERVFGESFMVNVVTAEEGVWQEDFAAGTRPEGWFTEGWQFKGGTASIVTPSDGMEGMMGGSSPFYYLLTPALTIESPLQVLAFAARTTGGSGMGSMFGGGGSTFSIEKSLYGSNRWEKVKDFTEEVDTVFQTLWVSEMQPGDYRFRFVASDSIVIDSVAGFTMKENAPDLYVTVDSAVVSNIQLGRQLANASKTFMVINTGNGTLNVDVTSTDESRFTVSEQQLSIAAGDTAKVTVTYIYDEQVMGESNAVITFRPANEGLAPQSVSISAYTIATDTWAEDFEPAYIIEDETQPLSLPAGWTTTGWTVSKPADGGMMAMFGMGGGEPKSWMATTDSGDYELTTPRLQAAKGDILQFLADMSSGGGMMAMFGMGGGSGRLAVYYNSGDDDQWTLYGTYTQTGTVCFKAPYAGVFRLKFKGSSVALDNFEGFHHPLQAIALADGKDAQNKAVMENYAGQKVNVSYDRTLEAEDNGDGTWTAKAHTLCLPYTVDFDDCDEPGKVKLYRLSFVDRYYKRFIFAEAGSVAEAGFPYLAVVSNGIASLNAYNAQLSMDDGQSTMDNLQSSIFNLQSSMVLDYEKWYLNNANDTIGSWHGTFSSISNSDEKAPNTYCLTDDGSWAKLSLASDSLPAFRAYFAAKADNFDDTFRGDGSFGARESGNSEWTMYNVQSTMDNGPLDQRSLATNGTQEWSTKFYRNGEAVGNEDDTADMPGLLFRGDISIAAPGVTSLQPTILTIDADGTRRCFDLRGHLLNTKPAKGVYIENGKKYVR